jgi:hypothetical protein
MTPIEDQLSTMVPTELSMEANIPTMPLFMQLEEAGYPTCQTFTSICHWSFQ